MKKLFLAAAMIAVVMSATAQNTPTTQPYENYIQVNGKAEREVTPDEIYIRITIDENDSKGKIPVAKQEKDMIANLKKAGFDTEKVLTVDDMGSMFQSGSFLKKSDIRTSKAYQLKVTNAQELAKAFDAVEAAGISKMQISKTSHSELKKIYSELRAEAMKDAKQMARDLAEAIDQQVGRAIFINDYNSERPYISIEAAGYQTRSLKASTNYDMVESDGGSPEFKSTKLIYNVSAKFELK